eukprot:g19445.t1
MESRGDGGGAGGVGGGAGSSSRFISQIFWPEHCLGLGGRRGYLIGWNTAAFKCLVVTLVTVDAETGLPTLDQTERALEILSSDPRCRTLNDFCSSEGAPPTVLGEWLPNGRDYYHDGGTASAAAEAAAARRQSANIWLTVGQKAGRPVLRSLYCCGCAYRTCCYVVFYRPCNPDVLEYLPTIKKNASVYDNPGGGGDDDEGDGGGGTDVDGEGNSGDQSPVPSSAEAGASGPDAAVAAAGHYPAGRGGVLTGGAASAFRVGDAEPGVGCDGDGAGSADHNPSYATLGNNLTGTSRNHPTNTGRGSRGSYQGTTTSNKTWASSSSTSAAAASKGDPVILRRSRIGHGTALVSPSAREGVNLSGVARDATGLLMGGGAGAGGEGAEDPTDLDLAIRQVSCSTTLERALRNILRDIVIADKRTARGSAAAATTYLDDGDDPIPPPEITGDDTPAWPSPVSAASLSATPRSETAAEKRQAAKERKGGREHGIQDTPAGTAASAATTAAAGAGGEESDAGGRAAGAKGSSTGEEEQQQEGGGRGGGGGGVQEAREAAGPSGRRSVSFATADQGSSSSSPPPPQPPLPFPPHSAGDTEVEEEEEEEEEEQQPLAATPAAPAPAEPSAPPSILRRNTDPENENSQRRCSGCHAEEVGGPSREGGSKGNRGAAEEEGGGFSRGKPPVFRRSRSESRGRSGGAGGRRSKMMEECDDSEKVGEGRYRSGGGPSGATGVGVNVGIAGRVVLDGCCLVLRVFSLAAFLVVRVLEAEIVWTPLANKPWRSPSDASLLCAHLLSRLKGALSLPFRLNKCWRERHQPAERRVEGLVGLSHWLFGLAADASLGIVACALLLRHTGAAARVARQALHLLHVDVLREELEWLNYFPAGFKLNLPLTHTLGSLTLIGMDAYSSIVGRLAEWEVATMKTIAVCAAGGGLTTALAVSHDVLRLLTLHTATAHTAFAALHNLHSSLLGSLWQLFRGRKRNVLRCRVDTCMYDACQLLLGTLVFTVLSFLTPTISVYYTFFCIVQAVAVGVQAVLMCMFVLINELPVYRFLLLLTSPGRLLSGFQLQVLDAALPTSASIAPSAAAAATGVRQRNGGGGSSSRLHATSAERGGEGGAIGPGQWESETNVVYFQLQRCRAPASALFQPYADRARRAARRYPPAAIVKSLISGKPFPDLGCRDFVRVRGASGLGGEDGGGGGAVDGDLAAGGGGGRGAELCVLSPVAV